MSNPNPMSQPRPNHLDRPSLAGQMPPPQFRTSATMNGQAGSSPSQQHASPHPYGGGLPMSAGGMSRMSPLAQSPSPYNQQSSSQNPMRQLPMNNHSNGHQVNGFSSAQGPSRSGTMGPPSLPTNKATDISSLQDSLSGTGVNIDEEDRRLTSTNYYGHPTPNSSFSPHTSFGHYDEGRFGSMSYQNGGSQTPQLSQEEIQRRREAQENWEEARKAQHPLWKMFLYGENLNSKLKKHCEDANLAPPQNGLYIAAKGQAPQTTRVDGLDNARRIVSKGEPILKTGEGDALGDILKTICLATQERLTGVVDLSARLAFERRQHSAGKVPTEWKDIAIPSAPSPAAVEANGSPAAGSSRKRACSSLPLVVHTNKIQVRMQQLTKTTTISRSRTA